MAYEIGFVDNTGSEGSAHKQMLLKIKTFAEANGWVTMRYDNVSAIRELIMKGPGLAGGQDIYVGFRSYESVPSDYYNLSVAGFVGYVPGSLFTAQPGYFESGIPAHNQRIDYWLAVNGNRIMFGLKVGTPVYEVGYAGFFLPYGTPQQYPYPLAVGGMLVGVPATRFSDVNHSIPFKGSTNNMKLRDVNGTWVACSCFPYASGINFRDTGGRYKPYPIVMYSTGQQQYGELDGVLHITGFNNIVENTFTMAGKNYVVLQDVGRTSFNDYYALELS